VAHRESVVPDVQRQQIKHEATGGPVEVSPIRKEEKATTGNARRNQKTARAELEQRVSNV
jgi:hypothetical protein